MTISKKQSCILLLTAAALLPLCAAPADYTQPKSYYWKAKRGNWNEANNWSTGKVPEGFAVARAGLPGAVITISDPIPALDSIAIGGATTSGTKLIIEKNARILLNNGLEIKSNYSLAEAEMTGGEVDIALKNEEGALALGWSSTHSAKGTMTVSGGVLRGRLYVGGPDNVHGKGILIVKGSQARIEDQSKIQNTRTQCFVKETGCIEFILDDKGVTPLNYPRRTFKFEPGAELTVDLSGYRGADKQIPLILAAQFDGLDKLKKTIVGQPPQATAEIEAKPGSGCYMLSVKLTKK